MIVKYEVGQTFTTNQGYLLELIFVPDKGANGYVVRFLDEFGAVKTVRKDKLKNGSVANPYHRGVYGVGYMGEGPYLSRSKGKDSLAYSRWASILERCYCPQWHLKFPSYKEATVCEEWHNFQNFAKWFYSYPWFSEEFEVDKDLLGAGTKQYSPSTCCLIPKQINYLICGKKSEAGLGIPTGVRVPTKYPNKFEAFVSVRGKAIWLGYFDNPNTAFEAYKVRRLEYINEVADQWIGKVDPLVIETLRSLEVEKYG